MTFKLQSLVCITLAGLIGSPVGVLGQTKDVTKIVFPNGFRLLIKPEPGKGLVALDMVIRAGALEDEGVPGIGQVVARSLLSGAKNLSPRKLAQLSDEVGGSFAITWDPDFTEVYIATTSEQTRYGVELLAETLIHPKFDDAVVSAAKTQVNQDITTSKESAFRAGYDELRRLLYSDSPYRRPLLGQKTAIDGITPDDVRKHVRKWFVPQNMVLSVVGDVTVDQVRQAVDLWFAKQPKGIALDRPSVPEESGPTRPPSLLEIDSNNTYVIAGTLASRMGAPKYAADMVAVAAIGGGKASRMFQDLREHRGLAYELGTLYPPTLYQSHALAYVVSATYTMQPDIRGEKPTIETVRGALKVSLDSVNTKLLTQAEVDRAKRYLIGSFAVRHQRLQERAKHLAWYEAMGLGFAYDDRYSDDVGAVTLAQVHESAKRLFSKSAMVVVVPTE